jgi:hypothetical protein
MMPVCSDVNPAPKLAPSTPRKFDITQNNFFYYVSLVVGVFRVIS